MNIYFACSIRAGRDDAETYGQLLTHMQVKATVLTEFVADAALTVAGTPGLSTDIYAKDMALLQQADAVVAEVTTPSLGVGYEIAKAEQWGKPVLALFRDDDSRRLSAMIDGAPGVWLAQYQTVAQANAAIDDFLATLTAEMLS